MHKPMTRAKRRKDALRMKRRALEIYPHDCKARSADHLAQCSCEMCGNPRRHNGGGTMQERRADEIEAFEQTQVDLPAL